jgi:hypothetical protein
MTRVFTLLDTDGMRLSSNSHGSAMESVVASLGLPASLCFSSATAESGVLGARQVPITADARCHRHAVDARRLQIE